MHELPHHLDFSLAHFNFRPAPTYVNPNPPLCIPGPHQFPPQTTPTPPNHDWSNTYTGPLQVTRLLRIWSPLPLSPPSSPHHRRHRLPLVTVATVATAVTSPLSPPPSPRYRRPVASFNNVVFSHAESGCTSGVTKRSKNYDVYDGI